MDISIAKRKGRFPVTLFHPQMDGQNEAILIIIIKFQNFYTYFLVCNVLGWPWPPITMLYGECFALFPSHGNREDRHNLMGRVCFNIISDHNPICTHFLHKQRGGGGIATVVVVDHLNPTWTREARNIHHQKLAHDTRFIIKMDEHGNGFRHTFFSYEKLYLGRHIDLVGLAREQSARH